jgi:hypothetical protein
VVIYSRNGYDFTERFPFIAQQLRELPARAAVLDGQVVASDADGRRNFARLHVRWTAWHHPPVGVRPARPMECSSNHAKSSLRSKRRASTSTGRSKQSKASGRSEWQGAADMTDSNDDLMQSYEVITRSPRGTVNTPWRRSSCPISRRASQQLPRTPTTPSARAACRHHPQPVQRSPRYPSDQGRLRCYQGIVTSDFIE